jgi:hypothetical protein
MYFSQNEVHVLPLGIAVWAKWSLLMALSTSLSTSYLVGDYLEIIWLLKCHFNVGRSIILKPIFECINALCFCAAWPSLDLAKVDVLIHFLTTTHPTHMFLGHSQADIGHWPLVAEIFSDCGRKKAWIPLNLNLNLNFLKFRMLQVTHFCRNIWKSKFWPQKDSNFLHVCSEASRKGENN